jgi:HK97 gp10 family phage protein
MLDFKLTLTGDLTEGLDKLEASLGEAALRAAGFAGAQVFQQEAKVRVPVREGNLRDNIIVKRIEERSDANRRQVYYVTVRAGYAPPKKGATGKKAAAARAGIAAGKAGAYYWRWVEFGSSKSSAKPFLRPSFDARVHDALEIMRAKLAEKIREATP